MRLSLLSKEEISLPNRSLVPARPLCLVFPSSKLWTQHQTRHRHDETWSPAIIIAAVIIIVTAIVTAIIIIATIILPPPPSPALYVSIVAVATAIIVTVITIPFCFISPERAARPLLFANPAVLCILLQLRIIPLCVACSLCCCQ